MLCARRALAPLWPKWRNLIDSDILAAFIKSCETVMPILMVRRKSGDAGIVEVDYGLNIGDPVPQLLLTNLYRQ